jgi:3D-(3,5/4)-trihydroxycyclohexane-1,2-dione acylhydrolase (decyclizing)
VRYFDRITRPEHILTALPRALRVMTDPANCGPVCLAFCQDTQAEAYDYPEEFFAPRVWHIRRPEPDASANWPRWWPRSAPRRAPVIVAGGGVIYSGAEAALAGLCQPPQHPGGRNPGREGRCRWEDPLHFGSRGVTMARLRQCGWRPRPIW